MIQSVLQQGISFHTKGITSLRFRNPRLNFSRSQHTHTHRESVQSINTNRSATGKKPLQTAKEKQGVDCIGRCDVPLCVDGHLYYLSSSPCCFYTSTVSFSTQTHIKSRNRRRRVCMAENRELWNKKEQTRWMITSC